MGDNPRGRSPRGPLQQQQRVNSHPIKIVRLIARLNMGGPAKHVSWLSGGLEPRGYETVLACGTVPESEVDITEFAVQHGANIQLIPEMSRELSWKDLVAIWKVFRLLRREKPSVLHTHTAKAGTVGRIAAVLHRICENLAGRTEPFRVVHTFHGHIFHSYYGRWKTQFFLTVERLLARVSDAIVTISPQQLEEIHHEFRVGRREQFQIVPLGLDLSSLKSCETETAHLRQQFRNEINAKDDEVVVGIVGRLTEIKNQSLFLRAVAELQNSESVTKMRFVVIGDGGLRRELESEAARLGIVVNFVGSRSDPEVFYRGLDVVVLTSLNEGTPLTIIEAMASGRAVVSTLVGGVGDVLGAQVKKCKHFIQHERGISVKSEDHVGVAMGIAYLLENAENRRKLGVVGMDFATSAYSVERLLGDVDALYRELLEKPSRQIQKKAKAKCVS